MATSSEIGYTCTPEVNSWADAHYRAIEARVRLLKRIERPAKPGWIVQVVQAYDGHRAVTWEGGTVRIPDRALSNFSSPDNPLVFHASGSSMFINRNVMAGQIRAMVQILEQHDSLTCRVKVLALMNGHNLDHACYPFFGVGWEGTYAKRYIQSQLRP